MNLFRLAEHGTTVRREVLAGLTTFLTMAYILFVQPAVLSTDFAGQPTGLDFQAVLLATCLASALATLLMGLYARYPIALAPGMGENFFFVTTVMALTAQGFERPWQTALGIVFYSGVLFVILSAFRVREAILDALSPSLRNAIAAGIGLFIAFIGLQKAGLVIDKPGTLVGLNAHLATRDMAVFAFGLLTMAVLQARRVRGAVLWGILAATALAATLGALHLPAQWMGLPHIEQPAAFQMDLRAALSLTCLPFIFVFLFMDMFDTVGTLVGVSEQAGLIKDNKLPRAGRALWCDAAGTVAGACLGTSTVTSYIESAAGVEQGGRTGLTAVTVAALFLLALVFSPLIAVIANYPPVTACALVLVGAMMCRNLPKIAWDDATEAIPSFLVLVGIPLSFSIADGLALGFVAHPLVKILSGRGREIRWLSVVLAAVLLLYFLLVRARL